MRLFRLILGFILAVNEPLKRGLFKQMSFTAYKLLNQVWTDWTYSNKVCGHYTCGTAFWCEMLPVICQQLPVNVNNSEVHTSIFISCCVIPNAIECMQTTSTARESSFIIPLFFFYWETRKASARRQCKLQV